MNKHIKDNLKKLLMLVPLVLLATGAFAAYTFVGPTAAPASNNTDGPLDISSTDQIKNGNLAVGTFQSRTGADFLQQTQFTGLVNGGTPNSTNSTIAFGNSSDQTSINNTGSVAIAGHYQSDSLKTGGGVKQLCADTDGTFYLCGASATVNTNPIYLQASLQTGISGTALAAAFISEPTNANVAVTIAAETAGSSAMNLIKNALTANAVNQGGGCSYTATPTIIGTVTILGGSTTSFNTVPLASGCDQTNTSVIISSYNPTTTMGGRPIIAE